MDTDAERQRLSDPQIETADESPADTRPKHRFRAPFLIGLALTIAIACVICIFAAWKKFSNHTAIVEVTLNIVLSYFIEDDKNIKFSLSPKKID